MFRRSLSETGALELTWPAAHAPRVLHVWVLLVDPERLDPSQLRPEVLLRELIRVPVTDTQRAVVHVPVNRVLGLALVARDLDDRPLEPPPFSVTDYRAPSPAPPVSSGPIERAPLLFAQAAPADLAALARRVAGELAVPTPKAPTPSGFGARQKWYLTRLGFTPLDPDAPRVAVIRSQFIGEAELATWSAAPPTDAIGLASDRDGLVDGFTADDAMVFYAVLEGPGPWRPLTLTPIQPLFEACRAPAFIGPCRERLTALLAATEPDSPRHEIVVAALRGAP